MKNVVKCMPSVGHRDSLIYMNDYTWVTNDLFNESVRTVARRLGVDALLDMPGVWEIVSEALNNEALDVCEHERK